MLPWKILEVVEHASDGNQYPADVRQRRCSACLTALYFLPGAVHDILSAFRHASFPPQASLPFTLESWSIAAKLSPHIDDDVALGARCVAAVIATKTTFSDTFRATVLRSDEGYLPILVPQLGLPALVPRGHRQRGGHPTRQPRQFRLAHRQVCAEHGGLVEGADDRAAERHPLRAREAARGALDAVLGLCGRRRAQFAFDDRPGADIAAPHPGGQ
ncbi:hypothetical protein BC826DRAFT_990940, partial [Russula brevipes]